LKPKIKQEYNASTNAFGFRNLPLSTVPQFSDYWTDNRDIFSGWTAHSDQTSDNFRNIRNDYNIRVRSIGSGNSRIWLMRMGTNGDYNPNSLQSPFVPLININTGGPLLGEFPGNWNDVRHVIWDAGGRFPSDESVNNYGLWKWWISELKSPYNQLWHATTNPYGIRNVF